MVFGSILFGVVVGMGMMLVDRDLLSVMMCVNYLKFFLYLCKVRMFVDVGFGVWLCILGVYV